MSASAGKRFDLIVVGGGPAGATAAIYAAGHGLATLLLDRTSFPRDKICGDALSGKSVQVLRQLGLLDEVRQLPGAAIDTIVFGSPAHVEARIDLSQAKHRERVEGFVIRRRIFDAFLFEHARRAADCCIEGFKVEDLLYEDGRVCGVRGRQDGQAGTTEFRGNIVLGADGYKSVVARKAGLYGYDPEHWILALRQYHANVSGLTHQIELHYVDDLIPGYFWMFPAEPGHANVGVGMLCSAIERRGVDLHGALEAAIGSPQFRDRFADAEPREQPVGWNLPVGSKHRKNHGGGFMLLGDAAGLIDPFTGEGIGNAMVSARCAAATAREAHEAGDFSERFLSRYDRRLWDEIGDELRVSTRLQTIGRYKRLLNFTIGKAARNAEVRQIICGMIANEIPRQKLANPFFYLRLLFS